MQWRYPAGLRVAFIIGALVSFGFGLSSLIAPGMVADLAGLPHDDPVFQQAGGAVLALGVGAVLSLFAKSYEAVRIPLAMGLTSALLSAVGGLYYGVFVIGLTNTKPYLLGVVAAAVYLAIADGYYLFKPGMSKA